MELRVVLAALRRSWIIVVACAIVGAAGAGLLTLQTQPFEAKAVVAIDTKNQSQPDRYMQTKLEGLLSGDVRTRVAKRTGVPEVVLTTEVALSQQLGADLLVIAVRDANPAQAVKIARTYANAFVAHDIDATNAALAPTLQSIKKQIDDDNRSLKDAQSTISDARAAYLAQHGDNATLPPDDVLAPAAAATVSSTSTHVSNLQSTYNNLAYATTPAPQIVSVSPAVQVIGRSRVLLLGIGFVFGAAIGAVVALVRGQMSEVVLDAAQVRDLLGTEPIGTVDLRAKPEKTREERERRNREVFGEILARTRVVAGDRSARVAVAGVGDEGAAHAMVSGLFEVATTMGADRSAVAFLDASRIFARPMLVDACRQSDIVVVAVEVEHDRISPLEQLGYVLADCTATMLPVIVRVGEEPITAPAHAFSPIPVSAPAPATPRAPRRTTKAAAGPGSAVAAPAAPAPATRAPATPAPATPTPAARPARPAAARTAAPKREEKVPAPSAASAASPASAASVAPARPAETKAADLPAAEPATTSEPPRWRRDRSGSVPSTKP